MIYNQETGHYYFRHFFEKDGLPNNVIYAIQEDQEGQLWISTNNGLSRFDPDRYTFRNYDYKDGLQSNEFNHNSAFRNNERRIILWWNKWV